MLQKLRNDYVVVALYVDDKTELPRQDWYTSPRDGKPKTTLGKLRADSALAGLLISTMPSVSQVLGLPRLQGVGQAHPLAGVANIAALAG